MTRISALARQANGKWLVLRGPLHGGAAPDVKQVSFFAPSFDFHSPTPWWVAESSEELSTDLLRSEFSAEPFVIREEREPSREEFQERHRAILAQIARGDFQKVVPAVLSHAHVENLWPHALRFLLECDPRLIPYGFCDGKEGMIGATPEILFAKSGLHVRTQAVAGTAPIDGPSLLQDPKERHEHELVIEDLVQVLSPFGAVEVSATGERPAGALKHLVTDISLNLARDMDFAELARRLHPSAALGGFPRREAAQWLAAQSEYKERGRFGAPFGWRFPNGDGVCLVAIRNIQWQGTEARIGSGCGVVVDSQFEKEWRELALKREAILRALGIKK